jgi:septum formation protein
MPKNILASQSPRRKQLLEWAEIDFEIVIHPTDESYPPGLNPAEVAVHIAQQKARAVAGLVGIEKVIIAADTIVVLDGEIIGKPKSREDGLSILARLSGRQHEVITGVSISRGEKEVLFSDITYVDFHPLTKEQIEFYFDKYEPFDKAGAYAIQEWIGVVGIKKVSGDFYNVMGLPVSRVVQALQEFPS